MDAPPAPGRLAPGIAYHYYVEQLEELPDFSKLTIVKAGVTDRFTLAPAEDMDDEAFAFLFEGYIHIPQDGMYAFSTMSNDGSKLFIGDRMVVNNDGLHKEKTETGFVALRAGWHPIRVPYFEAGGVHALTVLYTGPNIPYQEIPSSVLMHEVE